MVLWVFIEIGFPHSGFDFKNETYINNSVLSEQGVYPGLLLYYLQKGIQYIELEKTINPVKTSLMGRIITKILLNVRFR